MLNYENGNANKNPTGTSKDDAFKTLAQVNAVNLEWGNQVLFKKGFVFNGQALHFTKEDSGSATAKVIISTYGDGTQPDHRSIQMVRVTEI